MMLRASLSQDQTNLTHEQRERQPVGRVAARTRQDAMALHIKLMAIHSGIVAQAQLVAKDAIQFYEKVERKSDNKQEIIKGQCLACGKMVTSTASFRLVGHLLKCPLMPSKVIGDFQQIKKLSNDKICGKREAQNQAAEEAAVWARKRAAQQASLVRVDPHIRHMRPGGH